jgi:folate-dependent phosphoribosylglycinamide formyltransferase PurN
MSEVVILGRNSLSTKLLFFRLSKSGYDVSWHEERRDDRLDLLKRRIKRFGLFFVCSQLIFQIYQKLLYKLSMSRVEEIVGDFNSLKYIAPRKVSANINDADLSYISDGRIDLVILSGTRILSSETLDSLGSVPIINIHAGITPKYRGVHGGYWALANDDRENFGATLHFVDIGVDTGGVIAHVRLVPKETDNFATYPLLQQESAIDVLLNVIPDILHGMVDFGFIGNTDKNSSSIIWTHPTIFQYIDNYLRYRVK